MNIYQVIQQLIDLEISLGYIEQEDEIYVRNKILDLLGINDFVLEESVQGNKEIPDLLEELVDYACKQEVIEDLFDEKEILASKIMDCFLPNPSIVNKTFYEKFEINPEGATDYFYELSKNSNYIQTKRIEKNINYKAETEYGELDITINLSKPEKNPKDIIKEKSVKSTNYPKCLLCVENEGYAGRIGHPARSNHRMIRMNLLGEKWLLQYSPYVYYNEHCIVLSKDHRDMKISRQSFLRLVSFVEQFPHYFVGSNADLPIVGGSILSHDHYQGGRYEFAMAKAEDEYQFNLDKFPDIECAIVKWPMSVIRLRSKDKDVLVDAGDYILNCWREYSDPSVEIHAYTDKTPHNTITPIARKRNGLFELDLVLRNNRTSEEHPLGIFHPHEDVQHIKKENIGLIEVMGLAVLPARLKLELQEVEKYLLGNENNIADYHKQWGEQLKEKYKDQVSEENIQEVVKRETAAKFLRVLEDAGVFKRNDQGIDAFRQFIETLNR
ncbi:galactose-1-phosphate uridylyltransferase [Clostridium polyendosporum]|uniref:Galactose-1-phosphate uridylyltransferase n=1 Tax=Clostridium polyendosporum TaxID=69208 RepID=A0A919VE58_9CLOT|nr:UDP-glucose--hexose-1-phosphate uridylyltransferase [Clostridium polyendosporum]GIM28784.1 galactose-1-phosphate uridylyltransferase [Clostridium polyendosporum]